MVNPHGPNAVEENCARGQKNKCFHTSINTNPGYPVRLDLTQFFGFWFWAYRTVTRSVTSILTHIYMPYLAIRYLFRGFISVPLQFPGVPLPLGNPNLILGVQWLEKLGTVSTNLKTQTLKFRLGEDNVTLKGDPLLGWSRISLKAMLCIYA